MALFKPIIAKIEKSTIAKEIMKIDNDSDTAFVLYKNGRIIIVTQDIKSYGKYIIEIIINPRYKTIKISNAYITYGHQHFHVNSICELCLGNIHSDIYKYIERKRYYYVFILLIEFLNSFKPEWEAYYMNRNHYRKKINSIKKNLIPLEFKKPTEHQSRGYVNNFYLEYRIISSS